MALEIIKTKFAYHWKQPLLSDFNATFIKGNVTALLGENGTGKTSLLKLCCGLLLPNKGQVQIDNFSISRRQKKALEQVYFVPDAIELPSVLPELFGKINGCFYTNYDHKKYVGLLARLQVPLDKNLGSLSFGQQKKVGLAFAFTVNTSYLLLDEPTNGLDPQSMETLKSIIVESANDNNCIVLSTHHLRDVENLCNDIMILNSKHELVHHSIQDILNLYCFGISSTQPEDCLYSETTFGQVSYISKRDTNNNDFQFILPLYMNAVINGKIQ